MDKTVDKYPYKKVLYLQWYEAAIANLILFKSLKQRNMNHIYFLISDQGILLKATANSYLKVTEEEINKFFTAKIDQLEISASSDFYQKILEDIKLQTDKLKDTRDCPYINLVYSQKLKNSCLAMKKFGYSKPYQNWEITQREKRGFCYLIVRPQHRWKEIANNVMLLVKKRQGNLNKSEQQHTWQVQFTFEKFIWLYLRKQFNSFKNSIQVNEKKGVSSIAVTFKDSITQFMDIEAVINSLQFKYCEQKPNLSQTLHLNQSKILSKTTILSNLELEKVTDLIYHEYGLPNLVREIRSKSAKYLIIGPNQEIQLALMSDQLIPSEQKKRVSIREDIGRIKDEDKIAILFKLGKAHDIVNYNRINYVITRYSLPIKTNIQNMLKHRIPSLTRYYYYFEKNKQLYLLRKYQTSMLKNVLQCQSINNQVFIMNSFIKIMQDLHKRDIFIGENLTQRVFADNLRITVEPGENGSKQEDRSKLILVVREWVKNMRQITIKDDLQKINDPSQMLPLFDAFISENCL